MRISDILSGTKKRISRNPRKRRKIQPDNLYKITGHQLNEADARIPHLEDLAYQQGSAGAKQAIQYLRKLESSPKDITLKWDGRPAIIFGRNDKGEFVLTDKSGFGAVRYDGRVTSADDMVKMFLSRKSKDDAGREIFVKNMKSIWDTIEAAVPKDFRGYVHGDLLYFTTPETKDGAYVFTPNTTTYVVKTNSAIGGKIGKSQTGVVLHGGIDLDGNKTGPRTDELISGKLLILPPVTISHSPDLDIAGLDELEQFINKNAQALDTLVTPPEELKLKDFKQMIYTYMNHKAKSGSMDNLGNDFVDWLKDHSKVSDPKKPRVVAWIEQNEKAWHDVLFKIIAGIMQVKNNAIRELDQQENDVQAYTDGQSGGEGYVIGKGDAKMVNRLGFSAANFARNA